ncbi:hypothetical protein K490DRAFT_51480 [Saccharata proteae CBS 121410]|uniref:Sensitive to high expression protein 9, mitochondrial n=1 Tax=Saccharata proteae CBS 121410 TaxID=1314787 RepID=A0A9P4HPC5_9PEZI|nr:hypothetical protein K490DRAFT_51480 [Saccharata proteae CBS 121410]
MPPPEPEVPKPDEAKSDESKANETPSIPLTPPENEAQNSSPDTSKPAEPNVEHPTVTPAPKDQLPSHWESQRNKLHKKFNAWLDELLPKLATATQKLNHYTGTDYTGIEALRKEIKQQESLVRSHRQRVKDAKAAVDEALAQQSSSQKEVVGLLERKHSWSAADLERYMSLIRSEHLNEQAVRTAKETVVAEERSLEEARAQLEKRERTQYHEEQIWSDTIRRNSTWVTFGLMGVNILLLLVQLVIMEPWRRRRMVREIRNALEENNAVPATAVAAAAPAEAPVASSDTSGLEPSIFAAAPVAAESSSPASEPVGESASAENSPAAALHPLPPPEFSREYISALYESSRSYVRDLFSERAVSMRKVDVTSAALQGAAAGAALMAVLLVVLKPN